MASDLMKAMFGRDEQAAHEVTGEVTPPVKRLLNLLSNKGDMGARAIRESLGLLKNFKNCGFVNIQPSG